MRYQNGMLGVVDNNIKKTGVYTSDGHCVAVINHPQELETDFVSELVAVTDSSVTWKTYGDLEYVYEWDSRELVKTDLTIMREEVNGKTAASLNTMMNAFKTAVNTDDKLYDVMGVDEKQLVYQQFQVVSTSDTFLMEFSVRKIDNQGNETYTFVDFDKWFVHIQEPIYYSSNGKVYLMECLEEYVEISELLLGTTEVSKMSELEAEAIAHKNDTNGTRNTDLINSYTSSRAVARSRALGMINYQWTVLGSHQQISLADEGRVIIPAYVEQAEPGTILTGIPYCWGL